MSIPCRLFNPGQACEAFPGFFWYLLDPHCQNWDQPSMRMRDHWRRDRASYPSARRKPRPTGIPPRIVAGRVFQFDSVAQVGQSWGESIRDKDSAKPGGMRRLPGTPCAPLGDTPVHWAIRANGTLKPGWRLFCSFSALRRCACILISEAGVRMPVILGSKSIYGVEEPHSLSSEEAHKCLSVSNKPNQALRTAYHEE